MLDDLPSTRKSMKISWRLTFQKVISGVKDSPPNSNSTLRCVDSQILTEIELRCPCDTHRNRIEMSMRDIPQSLDIFSILDIQRFRIATNGQMHKALGFGGSGRFLRTTGLSLHGTSIGQHDFAGSWFLQQI